MLLHSPNRSFANLKFTLDRFPLGHAGGQRIAGLSHSERACRNDATRRWPAERARRGCRKLLTKSQPPNRERVHEKVVDTFALCAPQLPTMDAACERRLLKKVHHGKGFMQIDLNEYLTHAMAGGKNTKMETPAKRNGHNFRIVCIV